MKNAERINIINAAIRHEREHDNDFKYITYLKDKLKGLNK